MRRIGLAVVLALGCTAKGFDLRLTKYDVRGWRPIERTPPNSTCKSQRRN